MPRPHVQVIMADDQLPAGLREAIRRCGVSTSFRPLTAALHNNTIINADAIIVVVPDDHRPLMHSLRVLLDRLADRPRATLILKSTGGLVPRLTHPQTVPVTFGCGLDPDELTARLATMLEVRESLDYLHRGMTAKQSSEESTTKRYMNQLHLASQVQREFIPHKLPTFPGISFSTLFRPLDYVSGDIYDIHRLDESHIAIALADATGHGIPAALLTVFIKRALRGKEIHNGNYRLLQPDEVLHNLNEELLETNLSECQFVAVTYALLNTRTHELRLARGGAPYPILRRANGQLELLQPAGGIVGVLPETQFDVVNLQLEPGDDLVIYSDGVERVIAPQLPARELAEAFTRAAEFVSKYDQPARAHPIEPLDTLPASSNQACETWSSSGTTAVAAPPRHHTAVLPKHGSPARTALTTPETILSGSTWSTILSQEGPAMAFQQLNLRFEMLRRIGCPLDDLTALALHIDS
ncbi:MAG: SpoIIE family protein phosphatase [Planctomycetota bacterium]